MKVQNGVVHYDQATEDREGLLHDPNYIVWDVRDPLYEKKFLYWRANLHDPQKFIRKYGQAPDMVYQDLGLEPPTR